MCHAPPSLLTDEPDPAQTEEEWAALKAELLACDIGEVLVGIALAKAKENGITDLNTLTTTFPELDTEITGGSDQGKRKCWMHTYNTTTYNITRLRHNTYCYPTVLAPNEPHSDALYVLSGMLSPRPCFPTSKPTLMNEYIRPEKVLYCICQNIDRTNALTYEYCTTFRTHYHCCQVLRLAMQTPRLPTPTSPKQRG